MSSKDVHPKNRDLFNMLKWPVILYSILAIAYIISLSDKWVWFNWHPIAMILCFVAFAVNGTLIKKIGGYDNTVTHGKLMGIAALLCVFGWFVAETDEEYKLETVTLHHRLGGVTWISFVLLGVGGFIGLHPDYGLMKGNQTLRSFHKYGGRILTALSWFVSVLGFAELQPELWKQIIFGVPLLIFGFFVLV